MAKKKFQDNKNGNLPFSESRIDFNKSFPAMQSPFVGLTHERHSEVLAEIGRSAKEEYARILQELDKTFENYDPLQLLSMLAFYNLTIGVSEQSGVDLNKKPFGINQFHAEFSQALILRSKKYKHEEFASSSAFQNLMDNLIKFSNAINFKDYDSSLLQMTEEERAQSSLIKAIQGHTQVVRNWGFFKEVKEISLELFSDLDPLFKAANGFSATEAIGFFEFLLSSTEAGATEHMETMRLFLKSKNKKEIVINYHTKVLNKHMADAEKFIASEVFKTSSVKQLKFLLMSHYDLFLKDRFLYSCKDVSEGIGIDQETISEIVTYFSNEFGGLKDSIVDHFIYDNPVWQKPLVRISSDQFFCSIPQVFFSFILRILTAAGKSFQDIVSKRRADFLEEKIEEIVKTRFPSQKTFRSVKWKDNGIEFENDLITAIDSCLLIIEAKSGQITLPALRGAHNRLKKHLKEIIIDPNQQSQRLKEKILGSQKNPSELKRLSKELKIDLSKIKKVFRISVSLEDFAMIQSNVNQHKNTGWFPKDYSPCPTMNLADFKIIFDLLDHPLMIFHYLERREEIEKNCVCIGDELDFIGHYVDTLLDSNYFPIQKDLIIQLDGSDIKVHQYYDSLSHEVVLEKPKPQLDPMWEELISKIEERGFDQWPEVGLILLQISPENQKRIARKIQGIRMNVKKNWSKSGHINTAIYAPPAGSDTSICFIFFCDENRSERDNLIDSAVQRSFQGAEHITQSLTIAINIDILERPYESIRLYIR